MTPKSVTFDKLKCRFLGIMFRQAKEKEVMVIIQWYFIFILSLFMYLHLLIPFPCLAVNDYWLLFFHYLAADKKGQIGFEKNESERESIKLLKNNLKSLHNSLHGLSF